MDFFVFPRWVNRLRPALAAAVVLAPVYAVAVVYYGCSPKTTDIGYQPTQPVAYSHAMHAGDLGMDCRYCHNTVEIAPHAAVPPTQTCMNCHATLRAQSDKNIPVRESYATGMPIQWMRVHDIPNYEYFNHSAHVTRGIGCVSCHGRIDKMEVVRQEKLLTMGWCLDCHRNPEQNLRPLDAITEMDWVPPEGDQLALGRRLKEEYGIRSLTDCWVCHR
ncbi:MAG: cytochrome c3 family protein [Candidatus Sumerlaeota bacterium]|nr:cytochrome c3 family protein [Candidatus Sumerlaeota bacterium]